MDILNIYEQTLRVDAVLNGIKTKFPFQLNEKARFTQHQITLYQSNYCHVDSEPVAEQPAITGGDFTDIVFIDI